jgi:hypothetical protein
MNISFWEKEAFLSESDIAIMGAGLVISFSFLPSF